jgi:hypothetical protein
VVVFFLRGVSKIFNLGMGQFGAVAAEQAGSRFFIGGIEKFR